MFTVQKNIIFRSSEQLGHLLGCKLDPKQLQNVLVKTYHKCEKKMRILANCVTWYVMANNVFDKEVCVSH